MAGSEYTTKQGKLIADCLRENASVHLTADEISNLLKKKGNVVSTATIYRRLEKLTSNGTVRKYITSPDEPACYQYNGTDADCANHFHLKCTCCNKLIHVDCRYIEELERHIEDHHGFLVDNTRTVLYGVCANCRGGKKDEDEA